MERIGELEIVVADLQARLLDATQRIEEQNRLITEMQNERVTGTDTRSKKLDLGKPKVFDGMGDASEAEFETFSFKLEALIGNHDATTLEHMRVARARSEPMNNAGYTADQRQRSIELFYKLVMLTDVKVVRKVA